jgi:hypothetical protein
VHHNPDFIDKVCLHCSWPEFAGEPSNFKPKPQTNFDRIVSMTPEELAAWLNRHVAICTPGKSPGRDCLHVTDGSPCEACWLDYLKQEGE